MGGHNCPSPADARANQTRAETFASRTSTPRMVGVVLGVSSQNRCGRYTAPAKQGAHPAWEGIESSPWREASRGAARTQPGQATAHQGKLCAHVDSAGRLEGMRVRTRSAAHVSISPYPRGDENLRLGHKFFFVPPPPVLAVAYFRRTAENES